MKFDFFERQNSGTEKQIRDASLQFKKLKGKSADYENTIEPSKRPITPEQKS